MYYYTTIAINDTKSTTMVLKKQTKNKNPFRSHSLTCLEVRSTTFVIVVASTFLNATVQRRGSHLLSEDDITV